MSMDKIEVLPGWWGRGKGRGDGGKGRRGVKGGWGVVKGEARVRGSITDSGFRTNSLHVA